MTHVFTAQVTHSADDGKYRMRRVRRSPSPGSTPFLTLWAHPDANRKLGSAGNLTPDQGSIMYVKYLYALCVLFGQVGNMPGRILEISFSHVLSSNPAEVCLLSSFLN